jgi:hypothetical protein
LLQQTDSQFTIIDAKNFFTYVGECSKILGVDNELKFLAKIKVTCLELNNLHGDAAYFKSFIENINEVHSNHQEWQ